MALTGTWPRSLDDKQRLALPKRLRDDFGEGELTVLYAAPGTDRAVVLYSPAGFERLAQQVLSQPAHREDVRNFARLYYARADKLELDSQGRIRLPDRLMQLAGLQREVVVLGVNDHVEVWAAAAWEEFLAQLAPQFDQLASQAFQGPS